MDRLTFIKGVRARQKQMGTRFWEIDALRGVAIIMMVIYHLMWDLWFYRVLPDVVLWDGFWKYFQRTTATLFIFLVGVSLTVSYNRVVEKQKNSHGLWRKFLLRGLRVFGLGMIISLGVYLANTGRIHFGVLHLIGVSIILAYPLLAYRVVNLLLGVGLILLGQYVQTLHTDSLWLVWLGISPRSYFAVDYFPLIPWFGLVLVGAAVGNTLYRRNRRIFLLPNLSNYPPFNILQQLGRWSLPIYLVHQPLLFAILVLLGLIEVR